ncbi:MAG: MFS transporter [Nitrospirae bacterium]|nr:MAG: MFS transporter [Nitrospirota bacterium]
MKNTLSPYIEAFRNRRIAAVMLLGFSSGLPLALTAGTLQAWLTVSGIDLVTIGLLSAVGLPYTVKFLWSPLMDRFSLPWLGRRRGWILLAQILIAVNIAAMSLLSPQSAPIALSILALSLAFLSASQDIVIDAYRTDVLHDSERGAGVAVSVMAYRIAMLVSGALALIIADRIGWQSTYMLMSVVMLIGVCGTFLGPEPDGRIHTPKTLQQAVLGPLKDYFLRDAAILMLALIILYKLGDAYAGSLTTAFLIRGVGFTPTEVGAINKGLGLISTIVGALAGGALMVRLKLYGSLMLFGILQAASNLSFMLLAWAGKSYALLIFAVGFENLCGGMGTAAFVSLLMSLCNQQFSATQYAVLSSLAALGRTFIAPTAGFVVEGIGWPAFFFVTVLTALPGLVLLRALRSRVEEIHKN